MTPNAKTWIHRIYGILVGVATVVAGICLIAACCNIYYTGISQDVPQIYTRAVVAESFAKIALPVYICLALVIGGILLNLLLPRQKAKQLPEKNLPLILSRLHAKTDLEQCDETFRRLVLTQKKVRKVHTIISASLLAIGGLIFLIYACNGKHWGANSTPSMVSAMYRMLLCLTIPLLYTLFTAYLCRRSMAREIELMKHAAVLAPKAAEPAMPKATKSRQMPIVQLAVIAIAVVLVVVGVCNGGTADILTKAVNICTECVGLG